MGLAYDRRDVLIWGKTYPELSYHHTETVCTGGCLRDGSPIRIYPVPLRYLEVQRQYRLYDWISVPLAPSDKDSRPESYKVKPNRIRVEDHVGTEHGWANRREIIFRNQSWHYNCLDDLKREQTESSKSLGLVKVGEVQDIWIEDRSEEARTEHETKLEELRSQHDLFREEHKDLEFFPYRVRLAWRCKRLKGSSPCQGHTAAIFDWGLNELGRRDGVGKAKDKMREVADLNQHDLRLFMGNLKQYPTTFTIVGLWYPKLEQMRQRELFIPE